MSNPTEKDVVGRSLYLELRKGAYTYQLVIVPDTISMDKTSVFPATLLSRRISTFHPRRNWTFNRGTRRIERDVDGTMRQHELESAKSFADLRANEVVAFTMNHLFTKGYTLHAQPIFVEMTYKDAQSIANQKTPNDLWRRIVRSRTEFGFGEDFFNAVA